MFVHMRTYTPHIHKYTHTVPTYKLLFNNLCVDGMKRCGPYGYLCTYLLEVFGSAACGDQTQTRETTDYI